MQNRRNSGIVPHSLFMIPVLHLSQARLFFLSMLAALSMASPAWAELAWKQTTVQIKADAAQAVLEVRFPFTNKGDKAVDIQQIESSCGCTTAELPQRHYEPNQGGEIVAKYTVGNHVGTQRKTIAVKSNDQAEPTILTLVADIPELLRITPSFVTWSKNEAKKPKKLILETVDDGTLADIQLQSSNPAMQAKLETLAKGHKYQITVTPGTTEHFVFATLSLNCRFGKELERTFRAYATVKPTVAQD